MTLGYSDVGNGSSATSVSTRTTVLTTAANDAVIAAAVYPNTSANSGITATYSDSGATNASMTMIGSPINFGTNAGNTCYLALFKIEGVAGGPDDSASVTVTTAVTCTGIMLNAEAFTDGVVGSTVTSHTASGSTITTGAVSSATGRMLFNVLAQIATAPTFSSYTQTSRWTTNSPWGILLGDAAGAASVTFTASSNKTGVNVGAAVELTQSTGATVQPSGIASGEAFGTATVTPGAATVSPSSVSSSETFGTAVIGASGDAVVAPSGITSAEAFGTPTVVPPPGSITASGIGTAEALGTPVVTGGLLDASVNKLLAGQDSTWIGAGDSILFGPYDDGFSSATSPWTPGTLCGWLGRDAIAVGMYTNAHVVARVWNYPSNTGYGSPITLYTAVGSGRPTLTVYIGGWPGATASNLRSKEAELFPVSNPDFLILNDGFNETSTSTYTTNMLALIDSIQATRCPGVPILVATANATTVTQLHGISFVTMFNALITALIPGKSLPLSPALQLATTRSGVFMLDTRQSGITSTDLHVDGVHPIASGYAKLAVWMLYQLAPYIVQYLFPSGTGSAEAFGTAAVASIAAIAPSAINSGEGVGSPVIAQDGLSIIAPGGINSGEAIGGPTVVPGAVTVSAAGVASTELIGAPEVTTGEDTAEESGGTMTLTNTAGAFMTLANLP